MSEVIRNDLTKLKDVQIPAAGEKPVEQNPEALKVSEQKMDLWDVAYAHHCSAKAKKAEKQAAKEQALEAKKLAKEEAKKNKKPLSKGKIIVGATLGAAVVGTIGKALIKMVTQNQNQTCMETEDEDLVELDDAPVEETESE